MKLRKIINKALQVVSLVLFVLSVFQPWFSERGTSPLAVFPPIGVHTQYWTYQSETQMFQGSLTPYRVYNLRFQEYWFGREHHPIFSELWLLILLFQILTVASSILSLLKPRVRGYTLPLFGTILTSSVTITVGYYQYMQLLDQSGWNYHRVSIEPGFLLTIFSFLLLLTSVLMYVAIKNKTTTNPSQQGSS